MSSTTTRLGLYKPAADGSENVNVVSDLNDNLDRLDAFVSAVPCTSSTRPTTRFSGMFARESDTGKLIMCTDPTTPVWVQVHVSGTTVVDNMALAGSLTTTSGITSERSSSTSLAFTAKTAAASTPQLTIRADGMQSFGSGSASADVTIARTNTAELTVSGDLVIGDDLTVTDAAAIGGNATVAGTLSVRGKDAGGGCRASASSTSSTAAITSETVIMTISSFVFKAGRAYRVTMVGGLVSSAAGILADIRLKKTSTAGATIAEFYRYAGQGALPIDMFGTRFCRNSSGSDVTTDVVLTMQRTGGTGDVTCWAGAGNPRSLLIEDCGTSADFSWANTV